MLDLIIVVLFAAWTLRLGLRARKKASENPAEYFLAGRSLSGWKSGISMAATQFSADTPLLVMGLIATGGIYVNWRLWIYGIAFLMMGFLFAKSWRRSGVLTDAELTEVRYSGGAVTLLRTLKAIYYGGIFNCLALAMTLAAGARIAELFLPWHLWLPEHAYAVCTQLTSVLGFSFGESLTGLNQTTYDTNLTLSILILAGFALFYSAIGGLRGVVDSDLIQFGLALLGTLLFAAYVAAEAGGIGAFSEKLAQLYSQRKTVQTLSFSPPADALFWPFLTLLGVQWFFQINSDGTGPLAQRMMACRDERQACIAAVVFTWAQVFFRSLIWLVIGVGLLIVFPFSAEEFAAPGFAAVREAMFLKGVQELLPPGIKGLMMAGLLGALASTVDTHLNWGAGYWSNDLYRHLLNKKLLKRRVSSREVVRVARLSNVLILAISLYLMNRLGSLQRTWQITLLFGAGMGPVLILRWLWERINIFSEMTAMATSLIAAVLLILAGEGIPEHLQLVIVGTTSLFFSIAVTYVTPTTDPERLSTFFMKVRPKGFWTKTALANAVSPQEPREELWRGLQTLAVASLSLFLTLVGVGGLILPQPDSTYMTSALQALCGLALIPLWWKEV